MAEVMLGRGAVSSQAIVPSWVISGPVLRACFWLQGTRRVQEASASEIVDGNDTHAEGGDPRPHHCPMQKRVCPGVSAVSIKQRKQIKLYSRLTNTPEPDVDSMEFEDAARFV